MNNHRYILLVILYLCIYIIWINQYKWVSKREYSKDIHGLESTEVETRRIKTFENKVIYKLRKTLEHYGKKVLAGDIKNTYKVNYTGLKGEKREISQSPNELLCDMKKKVNLKIFRRGDLFFKSRQLDQYFPSTSFLSNKTYNNCAIVTNSGSLIKSNLGAFIDSHDFVIRFNNGPTSGYEKDVGSKTSLRVVNSQILIKSEFMDPESLYSLSPVLVWDPTNYNTNVAKWYSNPDFPFFENFFERKRLKPEESLYLLHPESLWSIWRWLQSHYSLPLIPHPTTSGFLGLAIALKHCSHVRAFEYIPSLRYSNICHYHGTKKWTKRGSGQHCTYGDWHPVSAEKLMALALNIGKTKEVYLDGFLTILGFLSLEC